MKLFEPAKPPSEKKTNKTMTWALVLGGAACVFDDMVAAIDKLGEPDVYVGVKDIAIDCPYVTHWVTYHCDRIPRELEQRRKLGHPDPVKIWTYPGVRVPRIPIEVDRLKVRGGSSGLLGALVGCTVASKAVLAGIPLDVNMPHYHDKKRKRPWTEGRLYKPHWEKHIHLLRGRVTSMSGFTRELLGEPTKEWMLGIVKEEANAD